MISLPMPFKPHHKGGMCSFPTQEQEEVSELKRLQEYDSYWNHTDLDETKYYITRLRKLPPLSAYGNNFYDARALGWWDAHRRMAMLEPLAADVISSNVIGDFVEAGVFRGGTSLYMANLLKVAGQLGRRKMYMADLFGQGMPSTNYSRNWLTRHNINVQSVELQGKNWSGMFHSPELSASSIQRNVLRYLGAAHKPNVRIVEGLFENSLPGPVQSIALLRIDVDEYSATYDVLTHLYPLISPGGYVVFDDWKIWQAQQAMLQYRKEHSISTPLFRTRRDWPLPHQSIDCMVYWKKV